MEKPVRLIATILAVMSMTFLYGCRNSAQPWDSKHSDDTPDASQTQTQAQTKIQTSTTSDTISGNVTSSAAAPDVTGKPTAHDNTTGSAVNETSVEDPANKIKKFDIALDWLTGYEALKSSAALIKADIELDWSLEEKFLSYTLDARWYGSFFTLKGNKVKDLGQMIQVDSIENIYWRPKTGEVGDAYISFSIVSSEGGAPQAIDIKNKYINYDNKAEVYYTCDNDGFPAIIDETTGTYIFPEIFTIEDNLTEEYISRYGDNYFMEETDEFKVFYYRNGLRLFEKDGRIQKFSVESIEFINPGDIKMNNVLDSVEGERIFFASLDNKRYGGFIIYDMVKQSVIMKHEPLYTNQNPVKLADVDGNGLYELSYNGAKISDEDIKETTWEIKTEKTSEILSINNGALLLLLGNKNPETYSYLIDYTLEGQLLTVSLPQINFEQRCSLPDRLFTDEILNDDHEIRLDIFYYIPETEDHPFVECHFAVLYPIGGEWYGPSYGEYEMHFCNLASGTLKLEYNTSKWNVKEYTLNCKFDEKGENVERLSRNDAYFGDHVISQYDQVRDVIVRMGGNLEDYADEELDEYLGSITIDNCRIEMFMGGEIVSFEIFTDKYPSSRGLKVGDTRERVLELYGNPDFGFITDSNYIVYYLGYESSRQFYINFEGDTVKSMGIYEFATD